MAKTAAQKRAAAKVAYNAFIAECPSRQLLDALSDKWVCLVLSALEDGPQRHGEIARRIAGVSQKMLTQTLRVLERDGMLTRTVTPTVPVRVDYEMTVLGKSLHRAVQHLKIWAEANMDQVASARRSYDSRQNQ